MLRGYCIAKRGDLTTIFFIKLFFSKFIMSDLAPTLAWRGRPSNYRTFSYLNFQKKSLSCRK